MTASKIVSEFEAIFGSITATERSWLINEIEKLVSPRADAEPTTPGGAMAPGQTRPNSGFDSRDGGQFFNASGR